MPETTTDLRTMELPQLEALVNRMVTKNVSVLDNRRTAFGKKGGLMYGLRNGTQVADRNMKTAFEWLQAVSEKDVSTLKKLQINYGKELADMYNNGELSSAEFYTLSPANEGTNSAGGYNVPVPLAAELSRNIGEYGIARKHLRVIPMNAKVMDIAGVATKPSVAVTAENAAISATKPTLDKLTLTSKKIAAIYPATNEYLQDANIEVMAYILELLGEQVAITEDSNAFGISNTNWPGLLYYGSGTLVSSGAVCQFGATGVARSGSVTGGKTGYPQIGDTAGSTDIWSDLLYCLGAARSSLLAGAKIFMPQEILIAGLSLRIANGTFIGTGPSNLQIITDGQGLSRYFFLGYEIVPVPAGIMMTYDASAHVSTPFVIVTNPMRSWSCMGIREGFFVDMSQDATADTISAFEYDLTLMRIKERVAFGTGRPESMIALRTDAS